MSNYLTRLVARTLGAPSLRPRPRLRFEEAPPREPSREEMPFAPLTSGIAMPPPASKPQALQESAGKRSEPATIAPGRSRTEELPVAPASGRDVVRPEMPPAAPKPALSIEMLPLRVDAPADPIPSERAVIIARTPEQAVVEEQTRTIEPEPAEPAVRETTAVVEREERVIERERLVRATPVAPRRGTRRVPRHTSEAVPPPVGEAVVNVSIGRIDIRVTTAPASERAAHKPPHTRLDDYLERRNERTRQ